MTIIERTGETCGHESNKDGFGGSVRRVQKLDLK